MVEITKDRLEMQYKIFRGYVGKTTIVSVVLTAVSLILFQISGGFDGAAASILRVLSLLSFAGVFVYAFHARSKMIPPGHGGIVKSTMSQVRYNFTSEGTVNFMFSQIGKAKNYPEKVMLTLLLADVYLFRGQIGEAISLLDSVDRSGFIQYPTIGMSFYNDVISLYNAVDDSSSVLAAYKDAEAFIDECAFRSYICCQSALDIMIMVEKAGGNYRKALDMQLMKNDIANIFENDARSSGVQQSDPMTAFNRGMIFWSTAELFYLCGDMENAGKYLDIGGPMLSASPLFIQKANRLSEKIRQGMMK